MAPHGAGCARDLGARVLDQQLRAFPFPRPVVQGVAVREVGSFPEGPDAPEQPIELDVDHVLDDRMVGVEVAVSEVVGSIDTAALTATGPSTHL